MMAGTKPFYSKLYNLEKSEHYDEMWEAWTEQDGEKDPEFKNRRNGKSTMPNCMTTWKN